MKKTLKWLGLVTFTFMLLAACNQSSDEEVTPPEEEPNESPSESETTEDDSPEQPTDSEISLSDFFLPDGTNAHYKGEGIEFAELDIEVSWINDTYVIVDENNGGVLLRKIYEIQNDQINTLSEEPIDLDTPLPTAEEISQLEPVEIYFKKPIEKGATFEDWEIIETAATVETPYDTFENAIVIEMTEENTTNRRYLVEEFGEVKRESIMDIPDEEDEMDEYIVVSLLESLDE